MRNRDDEILRAAPGVEAIPVILPGKLTVFPCHRMKKIIPFAALLLAAAGSWAFYPKTAEPQGYMMITGVGRAAGLGAFNASLTVTSPTGEQVTEELDGKAFGTSKSISAGFIGLHQAELRKINQYVQQGWRVVGVTQNNSYQGAVNETTYLLSKQ